MKGKAVTHKEDAYLGVDLKEGRDWQIFLFANNCSEEGRKKAEGTAGQVSEKLWAWWEWEEKQ